MIWAISREPDDGIAKTRISLGEPRGFAGAYLVFRGEPDNVIKLLEQALAEARVKLPRNDYTDKRGRPQG